MYGSDKLRAKLIATTSTFILAAPLQAALLEGKVMNVDLIHQTNPSDLLTGISSGDFVVGPGVELEDFGFRDEPPLPALVDIDISDMSILITLVIDQPLAFQERLSFVDSNNTIPFITSISVDPSTDWAGFTPGRVTGGGHGNIGVNLSNLTALQGQKIVLTLTPEPAAAFLLLCGMGGLFARLRRDQSPTCRMASLAQRVDGPVVSTVAESSCAIGSANANDQIASVSGHSEPGDTHPQPVS